MSQKVSVSVENAAESQKEQELLSGNLRTSSHEVSQRVRRHLLVDPQGDLTSSRDFFMFAHRRSEQQTKG